jgi:uncharacterized protein
MKHRSHPEIIKRLKRAHGHLASILAMFEEGRPCGDLAQQLHAVESAVSNAKRGVDSPSRGRMQTRRPPCAN